MQFGDGGGACQDDQNPKGSRAGRVCLEVLIGCADGGVVEVSTDGEVIVISPVRPARRTGSLRKVMERAHGRYAGTFKRLAR